MCLLCLSDTFASKALPLCTTRYLKKIETLLMPKPTCRAPRPLNIRIPGGKKHHEHNKIFEEAKKQNKKNPLEHVSEWLKDQGRAVSLSVSAIKADTDVQTDDPLGSFISNNGGQQRSLLPPLTALLAPQVLLQFPLEGEVFFFFLRGRLGRPWLCCPHPQTSLVPLPAPPWGR